MVTHLVSLIFFFTLSCADLHWNELASMIYKLKGQNTYKNGTNSLHVKIGVHHLTLTQFYLLEIFNTE